MVMPESEREVHLVQKFIPEHSQTLGLHNTCMFSRALWLLADCNKMKLFESDSLFS